MKTNKEFLIRMIFAFPDEWSYEKRTIITDEWLKFIISMSDLDIGEITVGILKQKLIRIEKYADAKLTKRKI